MGKDHRHLAKNGKEIKDTGQRSPILHGKILKKRKVKKRKATSCIVDLRTALGGLIEGVWPKVGILGKDWKKESASGKKGMKNRLKTAQRASN